MTTRRQASSTSLSKYARAHSPDFSEAQLDFCNAFWGPNDAGVEVLFARMRGAMRTMDELRNFWKERALIEEQYAKRLSALTKLTIGRDEVGDLRSSFDTLRTETEKQASYHLALSQQIKTELEAQTAAYINRQLQHKKGHQAAIEREFKVKQQQEAHVTRAREKYETDCLRINSYTAQSSLMQGKELENIQTKLKRAQATVGANEQDFLKFTRALQETTAKWEQDWKAFCDSCQDLEEERLDFLKDNMWAYANAVSTVCVNDDEACETMRIVLEQFESPRDMANFVRTYGTGSSIPEPPIFFKYTDLNGEAPPTPSVRPANFQRVTERVTPMFPPPPAAEDENQPEGDQENTAGIGAGGGRLDQNLSRARSQSRAAQQPAPPPPIQTQPNGRGIDPHRAPDPDAEPIGPNDRTAIKIGDRHYPVDLTNDPQARAGSAVNGSAGSRTPAKVGDEEEDPLARQMADLVRGATIHKNQQGGPQRRPSVLQPQAQPPAPQQRPTHQPRDSASQLSPPPGGRGGGPPNKVDYRRSAEIVVGLPPNVPSSRPASPNPPTAVLARPPSQSQPRDDVVKVLGNYQQSLPGEHKDVSRPGSRAGSYSSQNRPMQQGRPMSSDGMAGVGAQGRSPSPQPFRPPSRGPSPQPQQQPQQRQPVAQNIPNRRESLRGPPPGSIAGSTLSNVNGIRAGHHPNNSISVPNQPIQRAPSPNQAGIVLDPSGRVAVDELADRYNSRQYQPPPSSIPQQPPYAPPAQQGPGLVQQRAPSYPPPTVGDSARSYGVPQGYVPSQQVQPPMATPPQGYGQPPYSQYPPQQGYGSVNGLNRNPSYSNNQQYYGNGTMQQPLQQQPPPQQMQQQYPQGQMGGMMGHDPRGPSPQPPSQQMAPNPAHASPTGAYTDDGRPILFYVTALYDYQATIEEEFDFQTGDVIAVTATPEDGWWSGELLDEQRRQPGRHVFPSNFVKLF